MTSTRFAEPAALPGQFDDADEDGVFVELMRRRLASFSNTNDQDTSHDTEATPRQAQQEEDFIEDDVYEDDMYDELDEELAGVTAPSFAASSNHALSTSNMNLSHSVSNSVTKMQQLETSKRTSHTGRDDRATSEQCLDPRTRLLLFRLLSSGFLQLIDGCLSTGKEANVYYAKAGKK